MSPESRHGGRAIPAIGARVDVPALRYKMSQWRNPLILLSKQPMRRGRRYKMSCRRNLLFWLAQSPISWGRRYKMTSSAPRAACYDWAKTFSLHPRRRRQRSCLTAEPVVIDYETFCKIHDCHDRQGLTIAQTARVLGLHPQTVATWVARSRFEPRRSRPRGSVLDPFKPRVTRLLDTHPYSAQQIFQRLREEGYRGGMTILRDYIRRIRPTKRPVYLKLHFAPGECAQVDWGSYGTVAVGNTRRRLSFFVMVLAFSRQMFVEFTVSQTMEHFLACHQHGFAAFGGVPSKIMVDNLKSAVLQRLAGAAPVFNPRYLDFARHHGFAIAACNVARGNERDPGSGAAGTRTITTLFRLAFIATHTNVVLIGNVGLGKTHLSIALGRAACLNGHSVLFATAVDIINTLASAQSAGRLKREFQRYLKPAVLIVDELGYLPIDKHGADLLFQIISQRYERAPMVITTNRAYKHWPQIFNNDSTLTSAILDRVLHHADTVIIEGKSFRMKDEIDE